MGGHMAYWIRYRSLATVRPANFLLFRSHYWHLPRDDHFAADLGGQTTKLSVANG